MSDDFVQERGEFYGVPYLVRRNVLKQTWAYVSWMHDGQILVYAGPQHSGRGAKKAARKDAVALCKIVWKMAARGEKRQRKFVDRVSRADGAS